VTAGIRFHVYQAPTKKDWRWRLFAPGNLLLAVSGLAYATPGDCIDAINAMASMISDPVIEIRRGTRLNPG
jgi:hypothetical protein